AGRRRNRRRDEPRQELPQPRKGGRCRSERARRRRRRLGAVAARHGVRARARAEEGAVMHASQVVLAPIVSEKSYAASTRGTYTFRVHPDAHKTQIRQAVEELF